jgi:hypothetical protein
LELNFSSSLIQETPTSLNKVSRAMLQKGLIIIVISDYERNLKTSTSGNAMLQEFSEITRSSRKTN